MVRGLAIVSLLVAAEALGSDIIPTPGAAPTPQPTYAYTPPTPVATATPQPTATLIPTATPLVWSLQSTSDTACTSVCAGTCVVGQNTSNNHLVDCSDATADLCICVPN